MNELETYEQFSKYNINIFEYEEETQSLKYIRKSEGAENVINLLIVPIEIDGSSLYHFVLIKNLDKFLSKVYKNDNGTFYKNSYYCSNCLNK